MKQWTEPEFIARQIAFMDGTRFASLCNSLISALATQYAIPKTCLRLNLHTSEPDGGIDARCIDAPATVPGVFPRTNTAFQFKGGTASGSIAQIVKRDFLDKPRVLEWLASGGAFVYIMASDRGDKTEGAIQAELTKNAINVGAGQVVLLGRETIVQLLLPHVGVIAGFLAIDDSTVFGWEEWARMPPFRNAFQNDDVTLRQLSELRTKIELPRSTTRLVGAAGDGKTRLVLEALRESVLRESVVYVEGPEHLHASVMAHLRRTADASVTLVVDEVSDEAAERYVNALADCSPEVRLVMIGLDPTGRSHSDALLVEGLSEEALTKIVQSIATGIDERMARRVAADCARSPKLAVLMATQIRKNPSLAPANLVADGVVRHTLTRLLDLKTSDPTWRALAAMSLLTRVGWKKSSAEEANKLFTEQGLDVTQSRLSIKELDERLGVVPEAGDLRYVSPSVLADHLAAELIETWDKNDIEKFIASLTPAMAGSFVRRLRRLAGVLANRRVVEEVLLGEDGPFQELPDLEGPLLAHVLRQLAAPFPSAALGALERCLANASEDELRAATFGRRDVVWALEDLLWLPETFERAAGLLLRLAIAENESWSNNARKTWPTIFQTWLGRTAAGWPSRVRVVRSAATSPSPIARAMAAAAVRAATTTGSLGRTGNPPSEIDGFPDHEWRPATYGEWKESLLAYWDVLDLLLADGDESVRSAAVNTLAESIGDLARLFDEVFDRWLVSVGRLVASDDVTRTLLADAIDRGVARWQHWLDKEDGLSTQPEQDRGKVEDRLRLRLAALRDLRSLLDKDDFMSALRGAVSRQRLGFAANTNDRQRREVESREALRLLAAKVVNEPSILTGQWELLVADKEWGRAERFAEALGASDTAGLLRPFIELHSQDNERSIALLSIYEIAFALATGTSIDERLEQLVSSSPAQAYDILLRIGHSSQRFEWAVRLLSTGELPIGAVGRLAYSGWTNSMTAVDVRRLIAVQGGEILPFLAAYLHAHPAHLPDLAIDALQTLDTTADLLDQGSMPGTEAWEDVAELLATVSPFEVGRIVIGRIQRQGVRAGIHLERLVPSVWANVDHWRFFEEVLSPVLLSNDEGAWAARGAMEGIDISTLDHTRLLAWVAENPAQRARLVASLLLSPVAEVSDLHGRLLTAYGECGTAGAMSATFLSGSFSGSAADWLRGKLSVARDWTKDERPAVREWAQSLVSSLGADIEAQEAREAEERFFYES